MTLQHQGTLDGICAQTDVEGSQPGGQLTTMADVENYHGISFDPATGATIRIPAKTVLKFKVAKATKDAIVTSAAGVVVMLTPPARPSV